MVVEIIFVIFIKLNKKVLYVHYYLLQYYLLQRLQPLLKHRNSHYNNVFFRFRFEQCVCETRCM